MVVSLLNIEARRNKQSTIEDFEKAEGRIGFRLDPSKP
jgi:hypothetical protein